MKIVRSIRLMREISRKQKCKGRSIGFVPTMGALHEGHLSLIRKARKENNFLVVSIFVNPTQFGKMEDFKRYPRALEKDALLCKRAGVDVIFYPSAKDMYPSEYKTYVEVEDLNQVLCGNSRPGHFRGVATVVTKLLNIVSPNRAYFGQKDAQQAVIIRKIVSDLNLPVKVEVLPTVRQADGLALSSRNIYLKPQERIDALGLFQSLKLAKDLIRQGKTDSSAIINSMRKLIRAKKNAKVDYIAIVDAQNLTPLRKVSGKCLIALAVWIGKIRLIDNLKI